MLNRVELMGRMVRDPEVRYTQDNTPVCSFTIAVDRDFSKDESGQKKVDFVDCVSFSKTAEYIGKSFVKGRMVVVAGRLQIRDWEDKNGNKRRNAEIMVENIYFADSKKSEPVPLGETRPVNVQFEELGEDESGELPFE